jgi:hypothetical protein
MTADMLCSKGKNVVIFKAFGRMLILKYVIPLSKMAPTRIDACEGGSVFRLRSIFGTMNGNA